MEDILNLTDPTADDLERAKDLAEAVNKHDKTNPGLRHEDRGGHPHPNGHPDED